MRQPTLNLEAVEVESFRTSVPRPSHGTVVGAESRTLPPYCVTFTGGDSQIRPCLAG